MDTHTTCRRRYRLRVYDTPKRPTPSYLQEGALEQLWYVDAAYLAAVALANFMFPYILLPTALNPMQLMIPPNDVEIPLVAEK